MDHARRPITDWLTPWPRRIAIGIGVALLGLYAILPWIVVATERHARQKAARRLCEAELRALLARSKFAQTLVRPADPCVALAVLAQEVIPTNGEGR